MIKKNINLKQILGIIFVRNEVTKTLVTNNASEFSDERLGASRIKHSLTTSNEMRLLKEWSKQ